MSTYKVIFTYEDGSWAVESPDAPGAITWGRSLKAATQHAREAIATILELSDDEYEAIEIDSTFEVGDEGINQLVVEARETRDELESAKLRAVAALVKVVEVTSDDHSMRDIAAMANVTHGRIQQVEAELASR